MISKRMISLGLSIVGCVGVGLTSWLSIRGHEKAKFTQDKKSKFYCYAPAIASGVGTVACILGSHHVSSKEIAALTASCGYLAANRQKIMDKVKDVVGEEKAKSIQKEAAVEAISEYETYNHKLHYERTGRGNTKFYFYDQDRGFMSSMPDVIDADRKFNYDISNGLVPTWNDYFKYLGIKPSDDGEELVIPANYVPNHSNLECAVKFDYVNSENEAGEEVIMIFVDTTETPLLKELRE